MTNSEKKNSLTLEERLEPWLEQAEYLLVLVIGVMTWSAIFVNFAGFGLSELENGNPFPNLALWGLIITVPGFALWLYPIVSLKGLNHAKQFLAFLQRQWWLVLLVWVGFGILLISMDSRTIWSPYPLVQVCILILMAMFTLIVLLMQPRPDSPFQLWRKVGIGVVIAVIGAEIVLHGLVIAGVTSVEADSGVGISYGRVADTYETVNLSQSNQFGWHYVDYRIEEEERHILLHGDTFVQALQVPVTEHMGQTLETLINDTNPETPVEVMGQGLPGFGPSMYLNNNLTTYIWEPLSPDDVVVYFHLVNDFQIETALDNRVAYSVLTGNDNDRAVISEDVWNPYHNNSHDIIAGHDPINPFEVIMSYSMLWNAWATTNDGRLHNEPLHMDAATAEQPFGAATILYEANASDSEIAANTYEIAEALLADYVDAMQALDVNVHLVTIPYFPTAFYEENSSTDWDVMLGDYDLSQTETAMREIAESLDIEFLGMLNYLQETDVETIQSYYFENGAGHLTVEGHNAFAEATFTCFFSGASDERCSQ